MCHYKQVQLDSADCDPTQNSVMVIAYDKAYDKAGHQGIP